MPAIETITTGDSLYFVFDRSGESLSGWTLEVFVKLFPDGDVLVGPIEVKITDNGTKWEGYLTFTQTEDLEHSDYPYYLIGIMENESTGERQQVRGCPERFSVKTSWES